MTDIVERLKFDAVRCEATFSKGVATNIDDGIAEIERLRAALKEIQAYSVGDQLPRHTWYYDRAQAALSHGQSQS